MVLESKTKLVEVLTLLCVKDFGDLDYKYLVFMGSTSFSSSMSRTESGRIHCKLNVSGFFFCE